jgi:hypothetical protein
MGRPVTSAREALPVVRFSPLGMTLHESWSLVSKLRYLGEVRRAGLRDMLD